MAVPPGIRYLAQRTHLFLSGPLVTYLLLRLAERYLDYTPGVWLSAFIYIWSSPILFAIWLSFNDLKNNLAARSMGAVIPPFVGDWSPGSVRFIARQMRRQKTKYITDTLAFVKPNTFTLRMLFQNRILTREPEYIKIILATEFDRYEKGNEVNNLLNPLLGTGVFAADGDLWKFHRSMTRPFFTRDRVSDFDNFERHADECIRLLKARFREGYPLDMQDMAGRFTLDSATEFLFGHDVRSLSSAIPYPHQHSTRSDQGTLSNTSDPAMRFLDALAAGQRQVIKRIRFAAKWPLMEFWKDELAPHLKVVHEMIDPLVKEVVDRKKRAADYKDKSKVEEENLLENLVNYTEDPIILRDEIMNLLVAGRDTTAALISFLIYMLAEHPEILKRLRAEILEQVGSSRRPSYEDIRDMKYLRAVINETLRLYPPVPFNMRSSKQASLWPSPDPNGKPFYIPAGTRLMYTIMDMQRRKDLWGSDALQFDPDRFLDDRLKTYVTPKPFIFLPFNAGPRICLGQQFAYNEASFFIVRLLQSFSHISLALDAQPPETLAQAKWAKAEGRKGKEKLNPKVHLTLYLDGGLWVNMTESSENA